MLEWVTNYVFIFFKNKNMFGNKFENKNEFVEQYRILNIRFLEAAEAIPGFQELIYMAFEKTL